MCIERRVWCDAEADAALEVAVLETLTDGVLTACPFTPPEIAHRYVRILERCRRPHGCNPCPPAKLRIPLQLLRGSTITSCEQAESRMRK